MRRPHCGSWGHIRLYDLSFPVYTCHAFHRLRRETQDCLEHAPWRRCQLRGEALEPATELAVVFCAINPKTNMADSSTVYRTGNAWSDDQASRCRVVHRGKVTDHRRRCQTTADKTENARSFGSAAYHDGDARQSLGGTIAHCDGGTLYCLCNILKVNTKVGPSHDEKLSIIHQRRSVSFVWFTYYRENLAAIFRFQARYTFFKQVHNTIHKEPHQVPHHTSMRYLHWKNKKQ